MKNLANPQIVVIGKVLYKDIRHEISEVASNIPVLFIKAQFY